MVRYVRCVIEKYLKTRYSIIVIFFILFSLLPAFTQLENSSPDASTKTKLEKEKLSKKSKKSLLDNPGVKEKLLSMFKSRTKKTRSAGFKAVRDKFESGEFSLSDRRSFRVLADEAAKYHLEMLKSHLEDIIKPSSLSGGSGSILLKTFNRAYSQWSISSLNSRQMVQTDWRRVQRSGTFEGMQKETTECFNHFIKLTSLSKKVKEGGDYKDLYEKYDATNECRVQVSWCDGEKEIKPTPITRMISALSVGEFFRQTLERIDSLDRQLKHYESAESFNNIQDWASDEEKEIASVINKRRYFIGLECYRLDELLSRVCKKHSQDMVEREFFSHTGSDGKGYEQRATDVDWNGGPFGETLFSGSKVPKDVHDTWWNSEDNRPKLYEPSLNSIGVGLVDGTWTVVVGRSYNSGEEFIIAE